MSTEGWLWLSFADPERPEGTHFLGVAIVEGPTKRTPEGLATVWAKWAAAGHPDPFGPISDEDYAMILAVDYCWRNGINPGGEIAAWPLMDDVPMELRNRLLTRSDLETAGLWGGTVGERGGWEQFL